MPSQSLTAARRRGALTRFFRWFFWCTTVFAIFYVENAFQNLLNLFTSAPSASSVISGSFWGKVLYIFIPQGILSTIISSEWVRVSSAAICWIIIIGSIWATFDLRKERKEKQEQEMAHGIQHQIDGIMLTHQHTPPLSAPAETALSPPSMGAPLDMDQLPPLVLPVVRTSELEWLLENLRAGKGQVTLLYGLPGMGKTTLVSTAIHHLYYKEGRFRDGVAVYNCKGKDDAIEVLQKVLARFDPQRNLPNNDGLEDTARRMLEGKDAVVVLLNVEANLESRQVIAPLIARGVTVLLTAKQKLTQYLILREASYQLKELSEQQARAIFLDARGRDPEPGGFSPAESEAIDEIVRMLGYYPLAVKMVGAYSEHRDIETLAYDLKQKPQRMLQIPNGDTPEAVVVAFSECMKGLPEAATQLFSALAAFPTIEFSRRAAVALAEELGNSDGDATIDLLLRRLLIEAYVDRRIPLEGDRERLHIHPLLQAFASKSFSLWTSEDCKKARYAIASYYARYATKIQNGMPDNVFTADENNIIGAIDWAHEQDERQLEATIVAGMHNYLFNHRPSTATLILPRGVAAANTIALTTKNSDDLRPVADIALTNGRMVLQQGRIDEAIGLFQENLDMRHVLGDRSGESLVLTFLGQIAYRRGALNDADTFYRKALEIARELRDSQAEAAILGYQGELAWRLGRPEAEQYCRDSLAMLDKGQRPLARAQTLLRLGTIVHEYGRLKEAEEYYMQAIVIAREIHSRQTQGWLLGHLGRLALSRHKQENRDWLTGHFVRLLSFRRNLADAERYFGEALKIAQDIVDIQQESWIRGLQGQLARAYRKPDQAEECYQQALLLARKVQDKQVEGWLLGLQGELAVLSQQSAEARRYYHEALDIARDIDFVNYAHMALAFGVFLLQQGRDHNEGCQLLEEAVALFTRARLPLAKQARKMLQRYARN